MYMAESSIPNSGWGMYTAKNIPKDAPIYPLDVVIQVADYARQQKYRSQYLYTERLPLWVMEEYYWNSQITWAWHDAKKIQSIVPGLGMLANSHPGLVNVAEHVPQWKASVERNSIESGAYSQYKNMTFQASHDIPAGHEIMVEYGDHWFRAREYAFGQDIPLSQDYQKADDMVQQAARECNDTSMSLESDECQELWNTTRASYAENTTSFSSRVYSALPEILTLSVVENGTARHSVPNVVRSIEWLQTHGKCLDNLELRENSTIPHAGSGAFATRFLKQGSIVAPAPVVHLHRGHLEVYFPDLQDEEQFHWKGLQLLQNYMYGHPSTSLLFFPYSPAVNLINHSKEPNVKLQWSDSTKNRDWFNRSTKDLITNENDHAGLMMELVALREIQPGEEVFLDYGSEWQEAWDQHVKSWRKPLDSKTHRPVEPFQNQQKLPTRQDFQNGDTEQLPLNAMTVCWVDFDDVEETDDPHVFRWTSDHITGDQTETRQCTLISRHERNGKYRYTAEMKIDGTKYIFTDILRRGIDVVDRPYTANQFLRQSFRHLIQMPDKMIPEAWKDLEQPVEESCGLYMAESSIPNSGLGMYTGKLIKDSHPIAFPDIAIQCTDVDENSKLWHWRVEKEYDEDKPAWLLDNYYWNPPYTGAQMEATDIQSIVPGIGMLANSHTGAFNALSRLPFRDNTGIRPQTDPGAGASSTYHGLKYMAYNGDIPAGAEIFVEYGDHWFLDQEEKLGTIPLSEDFAEADELLVKVWETIGGDPMAEGAQQKWNEFLSELSEDEDEERVFMALPKNLSDVEYVLDYGTARYSARDSIKSIEWLEENGRCLDNIKPAVSSIPQAGYGAFATRSIKKGNVVTTTPLVQLYRDQMVIMEANDANNPKSEILFVNDQLLLNYCFGHDNSDFLLYPYSPVVNYINHDQDKYNAELRWSDLPYHQSDWLNRPARELIDLDHTGLIMEFVATRDIKPGEEILIDYGTRWQQAWDKYVETWKPNPYYKRYTPAWEFNDYTLPVRTIEEQKVRPYPENVFIGCYVSSSVEQQAGAVVDGKLQYQWVYEPRLYHTTLDMTKCEIVERYKEYVETADSIRPVGELYKVRVWRHHQMAWIVTDVPRRAIEFFDSRYSSDLHLSRAFRHEMDLPDHMFSVLWMKNVVRIEDEDANEDTTANGDEL